MNLIKALGKIGGYLLRFFGFVVTYSKLFGAKIFGGAFWFINKFGVKKILMFLFLFMVLFPSVNQSIQENSFAPFFTELALNVMASEAKLEETVNQLVITPSPDPLVNLWILLSIPGYFVFIWVLYEIVNFIISKGSIADTSKSGTWTTWSLFLMFWIVFEYMYFAIQGNIFRAPLPGITALVLNLPALGNVLYIGIMSLPLGIGDLIKMIAENEILPTGGNTSFLNATNMT